MKTYSVKMTIDVIVEAKDKQDAIDTMFGMDWNTENNTIDASTGKLIIVKEITEHPADKDDKFYCEECGTNFHSSNPCGDPRNEDKVVCSDCWATIDDRLYHEEQDIKAMEDAKK